MSLTPFSIDRLPRALEAVRQRHSLPLARRIFAVARAQAAGLRARLIAPIADPLIRAAAARRAALKASAAGRALSGALAQAAAFRREAILRGDRFAARSRAFCRALVAPIAARGGARDALGAARRHLDAAGRAGLARLRRARPADAVVAALALIGFSAPLAAPRLSDEATIVLTRDNPFAFRVSALAEPGVSALSPDAPTLWTGLRVARAERAVAPDWALGAGFDDRPLSVEQALQAPARAIELRPAPLWSPSLAAAEGLEDPADYLPIVTGSVPTGRPEIRIIPLGDEAQDALALGAFDTGPTLARSADAPGEPTLAGLAAGEYATGSLGAARESGWPAERKGEISEALAEALNLDGDGLMSLPLKVAPVPSLRPARSGPGASARITVVLTAVGLNEAASRRALQTLPSAVAFAIAPVAADPKKWVEAAQSRGRVALLEIPMEPQSYPRLNPGPLTLLSDADPEDNAERLAEALARAPGVDGVATYLGDRFAAAPDAARPVIAALKQRELFMLETSPGPLSQLRRVAAEIGLPAASSVVSLDRAGRAEDLSEGFARLEAAAKHRGHAIGVAVAVPGSVEALSAWLETLPRRGFRLTALAL